LSEGYFAIFAVLAKSDVKLNGKDLVQHKKDIERDKWDRRGMMVGIYIGQGESAWKNGQEE